MKKVIVYDVCDSDIIKTYESYSNKIIINYKYEYSTDVEFIVKVNNEIVFDSKKYFFVFDDKKEYIELNYRIPKNDKYYEILKGIYINNESLSKHQGCFCYIEFDLEECIERIDGFPYNIVKIHKSELNNKQIKNLENNRIYTIYEDMNNLYFVRINKEKDELYDLCCLAPNLINDNNIILLKKLSRLLSIKKFSLHSEFWPGGDYAYCLDDKGFIETYGKSYYCSSMHKRIYSPPWFIDILDDGKKDVSKINKKNILNTIKYLEDS